MLTNRQGKQAQTKLRIQSVTMVIQGEKEQTYLRKLNPLVRTGRTGRAEMWVVVEPDG